jgi:cytochrome c-type biogenesis protein CcmH/NrfG
VNRILLYVLVILVGLVLGMASIAGALTVQELAGNGLNHFGKAFYEATPQKDHEKAATEYRLAEEAFREAIRIQPDWVEPYLHLGRTYFVQKKYLLSAEVYRTALTIAPQRKEVYLQLASALEMGRDYEGAVGVLQELRAQEADAQAISIIDDFINRIQARGQAFPKAQEGGKQP